MTVAAHHTGVSKRKRIAVAEAPAARDRTLPILIALVALNLFVYWGVQRFDFVNWDDPNYLTENTNVQAGLTPSNVWWALTTGHSPYWHPLTWLSHLADVSLYGMDPGPHHVTSLIIHVASTLLLFLLLRRMTAEVWPSAFVAAMFAVHPLHVESVAWLAERKDVLSSFFLLVTIWMYVRYVESRAWRRYLMVIGAYALALMAKPMVVTLPFALLLLDLWPIRRRDLQTCLVEKLPLVAMALATSIATLVVQKQVGAVAGLSMLPLPLRIENALVGYVAYLKATIWPVHLAAFYPLREIAAWQAVAATALLLVLTALSWRLRRRDPYVIVGWLWYIVTVAPVIGLMQAGEQARADRFMYVPIVGLLIAAAWGGRDLARRVSLPGRAVGAAAVAIVLIAAWVARAQAATWSDSLTLWRHAAAVTDRNYVAYENLAQAQRERGQLDEAEANYRQALAMAAGPSAAYAAIIHNSLGMVLERGGRSGEARDHFAEAARLDPRFAEAQTNLANALAGAGAFAEAVPHYRVAIELQPEYTEPRVGLGAALLREGNAADAAAQYREALRLDPRLAEAHNGLGGALATAGKTDEAMAEYQEALRLKPLPSAHLNIALLLIKKGDVAEARRHLETALSIDPNYAPASQALSYLQTR
jgi:tetratricopeptide (TPR) repeat protein